MFCKSRLLHIPAFKNHLHYISNQHKTSSKAYNNRFASTSTSKNLSRYDEVYNDYLQDSVKFWEKAATDISWFKKWDKSFFQDPHHAENSRWFEGGLVNACYNTLDRHIENGRGAQTALIYDSPVTNTIKKYSFEELSFEVSKFAGVLRSLGVSVGDRVVIYNPMIPQTVIAMLACAKIGAIHSIVFGGFSSEELATRIDDACPKVVVSASCGIEGHKPIDYKKLLDRAIEICNHKPEKCVIFQRDNIMKCELIPRRDIDWNEAVHSALPVTECTPVPSTHPLYILHTSGTTGKPKGVTRDTGGYLTALNWSMKNIYGMNAGDTFWAASDLGWVVGHSYILYANGNTTILYEGKPVGTPDPGAFWRVISQHNVNALFTAPTAFRAIRKEDPNGDHIKKYARQNFRTLFLAGERADPPTVIWAENMLKVPVVDHYWMTETGWPITANFAGLGLFPTRHGSGGKPVPGYSLKIVDDHGHDVPRDGHGNIVIKLPLPPGTLTTLWQDKERFGGYFKKFHGYFQTGDAGILDKEGYVHIMSRTDDIINVAGHRLSTGHIEEAIATHALVAECAVFGANDDIKGEIPVGVVVLKDGKHMSPTECEKQIITLVREKLGPVYSFKHCVLVKRLPKTRSGKILRGIMKKIANGESFKQPATIDDPAILIEIETALKEIGYAKKQ